MRRRLRLRAAVHAGALALAATASAGGPRTVAPGTLLRWAAPGTERCGIAGRDFAPLGDTCWFPIDLLTPAGAIELSRRRAGRDETAAIVVGPYPYPEQHLQTSEEMVHPSAEDQARIEREQARVEALWARGGAPGFTLPLGRPLAKLPKGGRFGARRFFNGEPRSPHSGADYKARAGTPVLAAAPGVVALAEDHYFSGRSVFLDHGDDLVTMYFHLQRIDVRDGDSVRRGQRIGTVGSSGRSSGPHLHFGVRWHGARIDPAALLGPPSATPALEPEPGRIER